MNYYEEESRILRIPIYIPIPSKREEEDVDKRRDLGIDIDQGYQM